MNKRGQFFILTAVIFSALLFSISLTLNEIVIKESNDNFYEYSKTINREVKYVQDLQTYSGDINETQIQEFIELVSGDLKDKSPNTNFMFIYGNSTKLSIQNYGSEDIKLNNQVIQGTGSNILSKIKINIGTIKVPSSGRGGLMVYENLDPNTTLDITFNEQVYKFLIPNYNIVIFLMEKEVEDEIFVDIK